MQINILRRETLRVTRSSDTFYNRPLPDITAFWMELDRAEVEPHAGAFSLKAVLSGNERYDFARRSVWVRPGRTLLVNADEIYASTISRHSRSLSVFYRKADVASAARAQTADAQDLLDRPHDDGTPPEVAQVAFQTGPGLHDAVRHLVRLLRSEEYERAEGAAQRALAVALRQSLNLAPPTALNGIVKRATRDELLARVLRARETICDRRGAGCTLDELAGIACLSKYHFLRVFSEAFGESPLAFARRLRLETASRELARGEPLPAVARRAEFCNLAAFRRALRRASAGNGRRGRG